MGEKQIAVGCYPTMGSSPFYFVESEVDRLMSVSKKEEVIEGIYSSDSQIVVPLLGDETSPEMIVEVASSINPINSINAINIIEAPDQTFLEDVDLVTPEDESVKRRILSLKQTKNTKVTFESLPTHDVVNTIKNITSVQKCMVGDGLGWSRKRWYFG